MSWEHYIPKDISDLYEVYDYKHAAAILAKEFPSEFVEICEALKNFKFSTQDILISGGNESHIPKLFSDILKPFGWKEKSLEAELNIYEKKGKGEKIFKASISHGTHKVDFLKGRIAFDLEWNSKDQTLTGIYMPFGLFLSIILLV